LATPINRSVVKAFTLLKSFRHAEEWVTCSELSRRARMPEASGHRLLSTLEEVGAVLRGPDGRCRPGLLLVTLSQKVAVTDCLRAAAHDIMSEVSQRLNVTVHLGRLEGDMVTFIAKCATPQSCPTLPFPGAQFDPYTSALGKVLLSALPPNELDKFILAGDLVAMTPYTITDPEALRAELEQVRRAGYALDDREFHLGISCVAVPVLDGERRTIGAMSITERPEKMTPWRQVEIRQALLDASAAVSRGVYPVNQLAERVRS
jgi:IclR family acetate operon transcriptional repressor